MEGGNMGLWWGFGFVGDCYSGAFARGGEECLGFVWRQGLGIMAIVFKFIWEKAGLGDEFGGVSVSMVWAVWIKNIFWVLGSNRAPKKYLNLVVCCKFIINSKKSCNFS